MRGVTMNRMQCCLMVAVIFGLAGCTSGPRYDTRAVDSKLTAAQVAAAPTAHSGERVVWGGVIIITRNQPGYSEMEILSYPLDSAQRPDTSRAEQGRFIVRHNHYLEAVDYAPGRHLTVSGKIDKVLAGKVGDAPYTFPLIQADDVYLWPREGRTSSEPQFHFGIGVIFGR